MTEEYLMDLHNHSTWSDGINTAEEIIENAVKHNIKSIGITDHLQTRKCPSVKYKQIDSYIYKLTELKLCYKGRIKVLTGMEVSAYPYPQCFRRIPFEKLTGIDYILVEYLEEMSPKIPLNEVEKYLREFGCRIGLAHTNLMKFADNHGGLNKIIEFLSRNNIFWEINSNSAYEFFNDIILQPNVSDASPIFELIKNYNIEVSVGSDTHALYDYEFSRLYEANQVIKTLNPIKI